MGNMCNPLLVNLPEPPLGCTGWPWTEASEPLPATMADGSPWPRISVVTASYNQGQYIEETIRSVLLQGYPNLEYIVIDGGSTDNSVEIIRKYAPWLTYWISEPDRGQSHAINKGFARATGTWLGWLNSDDCYAPSALAEFMRVAVPAQANFVCGAVIFFGARMNPPVKQEHIPEGFRAETLGLMMGFCQPGSLWTRELFEQSGPLEETSHFGFDWRFFIKCSPHFRVALSNQVVAFDRNHDDRKSFAGGRKRQEEYIRIYEDYLPQQYRAAFRRLKRRLAWAWQLSDFQKKNGRNSVVELAERYLLRSIRRDPAQHPYVLAMLDLAKSKVPLPRRSYVPAEKAQSLSTLLARFDSAIEL